MKTITLFTLAFIFQISSSSFAQIEVYVSTGTGSASAIKKFDASGVFVNDFISESVGSCAIDWPQEIVRNPFDNTFLVSSLNGAGEIVKYDFVTGNCLGTFASVPGGPTRMKIGADNLLYVLQWSGNGKVLRYNLNGTFVDEFTNAGVINSIGMDWDSVGNLYVSSYNGSTIRKFDPSGNDLGLFISSNLLGPTNIWFDDNGDLITLNWDGGAIRKFSSSGAYIGNMATGIINPEGIAFLSNGNFLIGNGGTSGMITEFTSAGVAVGTFATGNGLSFPNAIFVHDPALSTDENLVPEAFVFPSVGENFTVSQSVIHAFESMVVYDLTGRVIERIDLKFQSTWNASEWAEGIYVVKATGKERQQIQRIFVRRN
jgi:hypothetical protein